MYDLKMGWVNTSSTNVFMAHIRVLNHFPNYHVSLCNIGAYQKCYSKEREAKEMGRASSQE